MRIWAGIVVIYVICCGRAAAGECSAVLSEALKDTMTSETNEAFARALSTWLMTDAGRAWAKSSDAGGKAGIKAITAAARRTEVASEEERLRTEQELNDELTSSNVAVVRKSITSAGQWETFRRCEDGKHAGRIINGTLKPSPSDWQTVTIDLWSVHVAAEPIIVDMQVVGARSYKDWTGKSLGHPVTQILERVPGRDLTIAIETTLGTYNDAIPAHIEHPYVVETPSCDPCELGRPGAECLGRFHAFWAEKLMKEGHEKAATEELVRNRSQLLEGRCMRSVAKAMIRSGPHQPSGNLPPGAFDLWLKYSRLEIECNFRKGDAMVESAERTTVETGDRASEDLPPDAVFENRHEAWPEYDPIVTTFTPAEQLRVLNGECRTSGDSLSRP